MERLRKLESSGKGRFSLSKLDARRQTEIAVALMAVVPALVFFRLGHALAEKGALSPGDFALAALGIWIAFIGYRVVRKYPANISALRVYIADLAKGTFPDHVQLMDAAESDDICYIETSINLLIEELRKEAAKAKAQYDVERRLRETVEQQQAELLIVEHRRTLVDSMSTVCRRLEHPMEALLQKLALMREAYSHNLDLMLHIDEVAEEVLEINAVLVRIRSAKEFRKVA